MRRATKKSKEKYLEHKEEARLVIRKRAWEFSKLLKLQYNKIYIKNQKTCWGSCSSNRNLNFNYKLLFLPENLRDYVIVHELCHLKEMNHSQKYWDLVEAVIPNYKVLIKELRKHERELMLD